MRQNEDAEGKCDETCRKRQNRKVLLLVKMLARMASQIQKSNLSIAIQSTTTALQ